MKEALGYVKEDTKLNDFMAYLQDNIEYKTWYCGHFHKDKYTESRKTCIVYDKVILVDSYFNC